MSKTTTAPVPFPTRGIVRELLHARITQAVTEVIEEELSDLIGTKRYERGERRGYRNGRVQRTITTEVGERTVDVPRARLVDDSGTSHEFHSAILPRYARRTRQVDEAILGVYLAGGNTRRIRRALSPLLGESNLSKSAVSRVVSRLKDLFRQWRTRDLSEETYPIVMLDAIHLRVRLVRRVVSVPILVVMGVDAVGNKRLVALELAASEASANWGSLVESLITRGLPSPTLIVSDGHKGLTKALGSWPDAAVQRCTVHKLANLLKACPSHGHAELKRDYATVVYAKDLEAAGEAYDALVKKWRGLCPSVATSLEEAGERLLAFYAFPKPMWKSLRSTNAIENLNREFRRRTKTQASFSTEDAAVTLLYGLVAFGQVKMRKIDGWRCMSELVVQDFRKAA